MMRKDKYHLQVWYADIETLVHIRMPYQSNVCNIENAKVSLEKESRTTNYKRLTYRSSNNKIYFSSAKQCHINFRNTS